MKEKFIQFILFQNPDGRHHFGGLGTDGKIILKNFRETRCVDVDSIYLALGSSECGNDIYSDFFNFRSRWEYSTL